MPSQNMPLKGRTDSGDPAEFRPQRLFAFELRRWEAQLGPSARISAGCLRGRNCRDFPPSGGQSSNTIAHFALDFSRKESVRRGSAAMEFELIDTGLFDSRPPTPPPTMAMRGARVIQAVQFAEV